MPDGKAAREARLAAALRENLKRRKAAVRPGEQHAAEAGQAGAAAHDERVPRDGTADQEFAD